MKLDDAQVRYLQETLGVQAINKPTNFSKIVVPKETLGIEFDPLSEASILLLTERELTGDENELARNIFNAVGEKQLDLVLASHFSKSRLLGIGKSLRDKKFIAFQDLAPSLETEVPVGAVCELSEGNLVLLLSAMGPMLKSDQNLVKNQKKQVWQQLKPWRQNSQN